MRHRRSIVNRLLVHTPTLRTRSNRQIDHGLRVRLSRRGFGVSRQVFADRIELVQALAVRSAEREGNLQERFAALNKSSGVPAPDKQPRAREPAAGRGTFQLAEMKKIGPKAASLSTLRQEFRFLSPKFAPR
jgi:hypothetical protein